MPDRNPKLRPATIAAQGTGRVAAPYREIVPPIHVSTTYERGADGAYPGGRVYSRADNPSYDQAEALIASLEGAAAAMLFASGQAAAAALFQSLTPGDAVLAPRSMYWALRKWLLEYASPWGLAVEFYENSSIDDLAQKARTARPRLIWIETPANPTWDITDIAAATEIARETGATVAVDSTSATPVLTRPIELGAHIVMHSATKYLNGHSDVIAGALATVHDDELWQRIRYVRGGGGAVLGPFETWLLLRGMRTLHLRVAAACANAQAIAEYFHGHSELTHVLYPGLASHPGHAVAARQMRGGFGGMMSLRLRGGEDAAKAFAARLQVFKRATSLGSVESLAEHRASVEGPGTTCPADLVRLSIGIEHVDDLIGDIEQALS
ncbi:MAG: PLP-dependent transferase [Betaproteobacteria bacterium]|nr:MAG: PLP-dependent transferase [Betaproteobacteria bacterium]